MNYGDKCEVFRCASPDSDTFYLKSDESDEFLNLGQSSSRLINLRSLLSELTTNFESSSFSSEEDPSPSFDTNAEEAPLSPEYFEKIETVSAETVRARVQWQKTLRSAISGEIIKTEKNRLSDIPREHPTRLKEILASKLWLELRSNLHREQFATDDANADENLIFDEEKWLFERRNYLVNICYDAILTFRIKKDEVFGLKSWKFYAPELLQQLLNKYDEILSLYPSYRLAVKDFPITLGHPDFQNRVSAFIAWINMATLVDLKLKKLRSLFGYESTVNDALSVRTYILRKSSQDKSNDLTRSMSIKAPAFIEHEVLLDEPDAVELIEQTLLHAFHILIKTKHSWAKHVDEFTKIGLPTLTEELQQLVSFPALFVEEMLKNRIKIVRNIKKETETVLASLCEFFKKTLVTATRMKEEYLELNVPSRGWPIQNGMTPGFNVTLSAALKSYLTLLQLRFDRKGSQSSDSGSMDPIFFKDFELVEYEWESLMEIKNMIEGSQDIISQKFCIIFEIIFNRVTAYLKSNVTVPATQAQLKADSSSWYTRMLENSRFRLRKLCQFMRTLGNEFENAIEYKITSTAHQSILLESLQQLGYKLVDLKKPCENHTVDCSCKAEVNTGVYTFVSPQLARQPSVLLQEYSNTSSRSTTNSGLKSESLHIVYVHFTSNQKWAGSIIDGIVFEREILPNVSSIHVKGDIGQYFNLTPSRVRVVAVRVGADFLNECRTSFQKVIELANKKLLYARNKDELFYESGEPLLPTKFSEVTFDSDEREIISTLTFICHRAHNEAIHVAFGRVKSAISDLIIMVCQSMDAVQKTLLVGEDMTFEFRLVCTERIHDQYRFAANIGIRALKHFEKGRIAEPLQTVNNDLVLNFEEDAGLAKALINLGLGWIRFCSNEKRLIVDDIELGTNHFHSPTTADLHTCKRKIIRWGLQILEFISIVCGTRHVFTLSTDEFNEIKREVSSCFGMLVANTTLGAENGGKPKTRFNSGIHDKADVLKREDMITLTNMPRHSRDSSFKNVIESVQSRRLEKIEELENARFTRNQERRLIGKVLDTKNVIERNLSTLASLGSTVSFRWQKGTYLGGGASGAVCTAINLESGEILAVKEIRLPSLLKLESTSTVALTRSIGEDISFLQLLHHENIVEYYGIEVRRDRIFIFMEYCPYSIQSVFNSSAGNENAICELAYQMLKGLQYLHQHNIVHRDIKPANLLLSRSGKLKFVDFGASKIMKNNLSLSLSKLRSESLVGTSQYIAPEVITGEINHEKAVPLGSQDIWSTGCCILEMLTGEKPWGKLDNEWAIMYHVGVANKHPPLPSPNQASPEALAFLSRCFIRPAKDRPTATMLLEDPWIKKVKH
ncbi:Suppressor of Sensor Kinase (SLN1) [Nowakowskiella sp. JEL0407]|nr:Suppressor of Sensor Kinase (SLN1) [Nowakowskiella sp. JEL0407]